MFVCESERECVCFGVYKLCTNIVFKSLYLEKRNLNHQSHATQTASSINNVSKNNTIGKEYQEI